MNEEASEMPKLSKETASDGADYGAVVDRGGELEGYHVAFMLVREDVDSTPLLEGLPDDRCQCPHWGYMITGQVTFRYPDRDETYEAGDAFYTPPGHIPVKHEPGTEYVIFSPSEQLREVEATMMRNIEAMQHG